LKTDKPGLLRGDEAILERLAFEEGALEARLRAGVGKRRSLEPRTPEKVRRRPMATPSPSISASSKADEDAELGENDSGVCTALKQTGL
jgi:hypothetical protein